MNMSGVIPNEPSRTPRCPSCQSETVLDVGDIPAAIVFAGRELSAPINGGRLLRCENCHLGFRYPRPSIEQLDALYRSGRDDAWSAIDGKDRTDWHIASEWIHSGLEAGCVLDVGCFDGGFLALLGTSWLCYGMEIHPAAAEHARERGVDIVGTTFYQTPDRGKPYTLVTAFDVIEHVENPLSFVEWLADLVDEGGYVMVSTGNMDARSWVMMGSRYWYCTIAEHISFISPAWFKTVAQRLKLSIVVIACFSHRKAPFRVKISQALKNVLYQSAPNFAAWLRLRGLAGKAPASKWPELKDMPPIWDSAKDHFLVILKKQPATKRADSTCEQR